jgi:hypothetical protein
MELYEWISVRVPITPWAIGIDGWIDTVGALAMCFIYDEFMERGEEYVVNNPTILLLALLDS